MGKTKEKKSKINNKNKKCTFPKSDGWDCYTVLGVDCRHCKYYK